GAFAGLGHLPHDLVPENGRARRRPAQLGKVGSTEPAAQNPQEELPGTDPGRGPSLETNLADTGVDRRPPGASLPWREAPSASATFLGVETRMRPSKTRNCRASTSRSSAR